MVSKQRLVKNKKQCLEEILTDGDLIGLFY